MKQVYFIILLIALIITSCASQNKPPMNKYEKEWAEIEQLQQENLPQSLLPKVEAIYQAALAENNYEQLIKAIIFQLNCIGLLEENDEGANKIFNTLKKDASQIPQPAKSIIYSIMGQMYEEYYNQNAGVISRRTNTATHSEDIHTWDARRIAEEAIRYFTYSLQEKHILQNEPTTNYIDILYNDSTSEFNYVPTLYDLLANRALAFYASDFNLQSIPQQTFVINDPQYFATADRFSTLSIAADSLSPAYLSLKTYQELLHFHLNRSNHNALFSKANEDSKVLIDVDIRRMNYIKTKGRYGNTEQLYEEALISMSKEYKSYKENARVLFELADFYFQEGEKWRNNKQEKTKQGYTKAYAICTQIENEYPEQIADNVTALKEEILHKKIEVTFEPVQLPDQPFLALLKYRNIDTLYQTIYPLSEAEALDYTYNVGRYANGAYYEFSDFIKKLTQKPVVKQTSLPVQTDYQYYTTEIKIEPQKKGFYLILISDAADALNTATIYSQSLLQVSSLAAQNRIINNVMSVIVTERETGKPISGANIKAYSDNKIQTTFNSDRNGLARSHKLSEYYHIPYYTVKHQEDQLLVFNTGYDKYYEKEKSYRHSVIFTDRSIYRPGQTVYYKALLYNHSDNNKTLLTRTPVNVRFRDANWQIIAEQSLTTNDFGSIDGSFSIPQGLLNGHMTIECSNYGSTSIRVEEYKRPTFEVNFEPVKENFRLNENVKVTANANALAGYAIDNAKVQYHVVRTLQYRYYSRWYPPVVDDSREIAAGILKTDEKGNATIEFKALADDIKDNQKYYTYTVTADITDINGETRSATIDVHVGNKPLLVNTNLPDKIRPGEQTEYTIETTNLNGEFTPASVQVDIVSLQMPDRIFRSRLWTDKIDVQTISEDDFRKNFPRDAYGDELNPEYFKEIKTVDSYRLELNKKEQLNLSSLKQAGYYKLTFIAENKEGVRADQISYIYLSGEKPEPIRTMDEWLTVIKNSGEPGEEVEFWLGGDREDTQIYCELIHNNRIIESKWVQTGKTPTRITYPIKEAYRGGFIVQFSMVQHNRVYRYMQQINVPYTNKMLDVTLSTFRDKLLPGEKETWTMLISNKKGEKEMAEVVASLYDASLDKFTTHNWANLHSIYYQYTNHYLYEWQFGNIENIQPARIQKNTPPSYWNNTVSYMDIDWYQATYRNVFYANSMVYGYGGRSRMAVRKQQADVSDDFQAANMGIEEEMVLAEAPVVAQPTPSMKQAQEEQTVSDETRLSSIETRSNFNETAFFYPKLRTNEQGEVLIEFTIPEALTRWKLISFAHTKDLKIGTYTNELITQKQVAISANPPRFFRENDRIELTAKVNNLTESALDGQALLRVYDAVTMQSIDDVIIKSEKTLRFNVKTGESTGLKWTLSIPEGIQGITYKITAQAGTHTDGEEKTVPVLTNSMLVTETLPFSIRAGKEKSLHFDKLANNKSKTLKNHSLTLEFTSAPAWYAVQSLPYIMEYPYECAEQTFSRYYANTLATSIVNKTPRIKKIFELWNMQDSKALASNLEKNQELKQVMLEETPWVMQAKNEAERKKRIGLLFDLNRMSNELSRAFNKLKNIQNKDGGLPWFQGNPSDRYTTQHIIAGMAHLEKLGAMQTQQAKEASAIIQRGLQYLDNETWQDYDQLIRNKADLEKQQISPIQLHYLYACSFSGHRPNGKQKEAFDYYLSQTEKYGQSFSTYNKAMAALVLHRNNKHDKAMAIIRSLKEHAQQSEEMGMYWKDNVAGYFWYQAPIETQAMLIEAFDETAKDNEAVEEMKIWLLRNKQTNDWKTTKATSEAIYALLMTGSNLLDESKLLEVEIAGKPLAEIATENIKPEPGTGYIKTSWQGSDISPQMGTLKVKNSNQKGIAWGGLYWQYFEQLDKITSAETNLKMDKQLFLRVITNKGEALTPINEHNKLKIGDLVRVRMELRADRDYEYVHLKDMRASGFEPVSTVSGHRYQDGLWYYESVKDASTNFFITHLRKGTYVFEYDLRVSHTGDFSNGITTFQCMYAPEFSAHSEGIRVTVE